MRVMPLMVETWTFLKALFVVMKTDREIILVSFLKVPIDVASERTENQRFRQPHYRSTLPLQGTPANIRITLILPKSRAIRLKMMAVKDLSRG